MKDQNFGHDERPMLPANDPKFWSRRKTNFLANDDQNFGECLLKFWSR